MEWRIGIYIVEVALKKISTYTYFHRLATYHSLFYNSIPSLCLLPNKKEIILAILEYKPTIFLFISSSYIPVYSGQ